MSAVFTVDAPPHVTTFSPAQGAVGASVTITGTNLSNVTGVSFNGHASLSVSVLTATSVTATVPAGATTGKITVSDTRDRDVDDDGELPRHRGACDHVVHAWQR